MPIHTEGYNYPMRDSLLDNSKSYSRIEASHLANDAQNIGALVIAANIEASILTGTPLDEAQLQIANPVSGDMLKPFKAMNMEPDKPSSPWTTDEHLTKLSQEIDSQNENLTRLRQGGMDPQETRQFLNSLVPATAFYGGRHNSKDVDAGVDNLGVPPYLRAVKRNLHYESEWGDVRKAEDSWRHFFGLASDAQILNFAQWYGGELVKVSTPEAKEQEVGRLKAEYEEGVDQLVGTGWITPRSAEKIAERIDRAEVYYRSAFSYEGGINHGTALGRRVVINVGATKGTVDHELTHTALVVKPFSPRKIARTYMPHVEHEEVHEDVLLSAFGLMSEMLQEATAEHMAGVLGSGEPMLMAPGSRKRSGLEVSPTSDEGTLYGTYLSAVSILIEGPNGSGLLPQEGFRNFISAMTSGRIEDIANTINEHWGHNVFGEVMGVILEMAVQDEGVTDPRKFFSIYPKIQDRGAVAMAVLDMLSAKAKAYDTVGEVADRPDLVDVS